MVGKAYCAALGPGIETAKLIDAATPILPIDAFILVISAASPPGREGGWCRGGRL